MTLYQIWWNIGIRIGRRIEKKKLIAISRKTSLHGKSLLFECRVASLQCEMITSKNEQTT